MAKKAKASDKEKAPSNGAVLNGNAAKPAAKRVSPPRKKPTARKTETKEEESRVSDEAIRIRAYFISEQRERVGIPGDANSDWIEARQQLLAELGES